MTRLKNSRLEKERGYIIKSGAQIKFALVYPNFYNVGMSNLGIHIIYQLLNSMPNVSCERFFLPEVLSVETQTPLNKFDVIGFAVSFEQDYFNVVKMLQLAKIKIRAAERTKFDPIIIAGGPCATFNPEPLSLIFDAFVIGEGEVILPPFIEVLKENLPRLETLEKISQVAGMYVPKFLECEYNFDGTIKNHYCLLPTAYCLKRQWLKNLDEFPAHSVIITDNTEFNMYLIETARGCGHHCRFCMAGYCFRKPRNRSLEILKAEVDAAKKFGKKIGLMGAAISDYPQINELCKYILDSNLEMSVASFRADSVTKELVTALVKSGLKTLTVAPEVGSEKMRAVVNKSITEENIFTAVELGIAAGLKNFKLYFMVGLPFEELADVEEIVNLTTRLKKFVGSCKLTLSVNPFVPKPFTPFQWAKFADKKYLNAALKILKNGLKNLRGVEIISESIKSAEVQAILARGDRRIAEFVIQSDSPQRFLQVLRENQIDENFYLRERAADEILAWDFLDMGFSKKYLRAEFERAAALKSTPACFDGCKRCGVCI